MLLEDPLTRETRPFLPGGGLDDGETPADAAKREAREETGHDVIVDAASERVARYDFTWEGVCVDCETHFFRARLANPGAAPSAVNDAPYHRGVVWIPLADVPQALGFHDAIRDAVLALLAG